MSNPHFNDPMAPAVATEESKYKRKPEVFVRPKMPAINPEKQADSCHKAKTGYQQMARSSDGGAPRVSLNVWDYYSIAAIMKRLTVLIEESILLLCITDCG